MTDLRVETGEYIEEGQLLAVIESNSLELELNNVQQEIDILRTMAGEAFARGENTEADRCLSQVRRLEESRQLILDRNIATSGRESCSSRSESLTPSGCALRCPRGKWRTLHTVHS